MRRFVYEIDPSLLEDIARIDAALTEYAKDVLAGRVPPLACGGLKRALEDGPRHASYADSICSRSNSQRVFSVFCCETTNGRQEMRVSWTTLNQATDANGFLLESEASFVAELEVLASMG